jgi:hypothetical protein
MTRWRKIRKSERGIFEPVLLEEHVLREIVERAWLQARIKLWRINCPVGGKVGPNERGIPDLIGFLPSGGRSHQIDPVPLFIEVKRPGGKKRIEQQEFIKDASAAGCCAFFADSWDVVREELTKWGVKVTLTWDEQNRSKGAA